MGEFKDFSSSEYLFGSLSRLGLDYKTVSGTRIKVDCPCCSKTKTVELHKEKTYGQCWKCGEKFNLQSYIAKTLGISGADAYKWLCGEFMVNEEDFIRKQNERKAKNSCAIESTVDLGNTTKVYSYMMGNLSLTEFHRKHLNTVRGLSDTEIDKLQYFSFSSFNESFIENLLKKFPSDALKNVPGLYLTQNGTNKIVTCTTNKYGKKKDGIFVPYRNIKGEIVGFQIRKDDKDLITFKDGKKENKYKWFTSNEIEHIVSDAKEGSGTSPGTPVHYACDFLYDFIRECEYPYIPDGELWLTEGAMKGDIAHTISSHPFVCIAGTKCIKGLIQDFDTLRELGVKKIVDCLDMDYLDNENVAKDRLKLKDAIEKGGFEYEMKTWNTTCPDSNHKPLLKIDELYLWYKRKI